MKFCCKCGEEKAPQEFNRNAGRRDGLNSYCKKCQSEYQRSYQASNRERTNAYSRAFRERNPDVVKKLGERWREKNYQRVLTLNSQYRARRRNADGGFTHEQVESLYAAQEGRCNMCRDPLEGRFHRDHVIPLKLGGSNFIENIQLLCASCNCHKQAKHPSTVKVQKGA